MMKEQPTEISSGKSKYNVFLRCTTDDHSGCEDLLRAVREKFVFASPLCTIEPVDIGIDSKKYCVMFDHLVNADQKEEFEKRVNSLITEGKARSRQIFIAQA